MCYVPEPNPSRFSEYLYHLQRLDVDGVGFNGNFVDWRDPETVAAVGDVLDEHGMDAWSFHSPHYLGLTADADNRPERLEANRALVDAAAAWDAPNVLFHANSLEEHLDDDQPFSTEILHETCEYASNHGVTVTLENLGPHAARDCNAIVDFVREQDISNLGFLLDSGHAWYSGQDPAEVVRYAEDTLLDVHLHDNLGPRGLDFEKRKEDYTYDDGSTLFNRARDLHLLPGIGTIDWIDLIRAFWEIDYDRPMAFENPGIVNPLHPSGHPDATIESRTGGQSVVGHWARCMELLVGTWRAMEETARYVPDPKTY